jgi:hypothetical protein
MDMQRAFGRSPITNAFLRFFDPLQAPELVSLPLIAAVERFGHSLEPTRPISGPSATCFFVAWNLICDSVGVITTLQITVGQGTVMSFMGNLMLGLGLPFDRKAFAAALAIHAIEPGDAWWSGHVFDMSWHS